MASQLDFPRPSRSDDSYWLCRCVGFRAETPERRLGVVAEVRYRTHVDRPDELVVRRGPFGSRVVVVPVSDVTQVRPRERTIVVERSPAVEPAVPLRTRLTGAVRGG